MTTSVSESLKIAQLLAEAGYDAIPVCSPSCTAAGCVSPGKAPHIKNWQRVGHPLALFTRYPYMTNLGVRLTSNEMVLDVDANKGGLESFDKLMAQRPDLPLGPASETGGGGAHYYFKVPADLVLGGGGSFDLLGYPGLEYKSGGGQTVEYPSMHVSGKQYTWMPEQAPWEIPTPDAPQWLLAMAVASKTVPRAKSANGSIPASLNGADGTKKAYGNREVAAIFRATYPEGARRTATGLPRLVGLLMSHGICVTCTQAFLVYFQNRNFEPPLPDEEVRHTVASMFERYERRPDAAPCPHKGETNYSWISWLTGVFDPEWRKEYEKARRAHHAKKAAARAPAAHSHMSDRPVSDVPEIPDYDDDAPPTEDASVRERRREIMQIHFEGAGGFTQLQPVGGNAELFTLTTKGEQLGVSSAIAPFTMFDPRRRVTKDELVRLYRLSVDGEEGEKASAKVAECGWGLSGDCTQHGKRRSSKRSCKLLGHADCSSRHGAKLRQTHLEDKEGEAGYRSIYFSFYVATNHEWAGDNQKALADKHAEWADVVGKVNKRKRLGVKGMVLHRAVADYLTPLLTQVVGKLMIEEETKGQADEAISYICEQMSAEVLMDRIYQSGNMAIVQLCEDSMSALIGISDTTQLDLFNAFFFATKGAKLCQGLSRLWSQLQAVKATDDPAVCDVAGCGRRLSWTLITPGEEDEEAPKDRSEMTHAERLFG